MSLRSRLVLTNIGVTLTDLTNIGEKLTVFTLIFGALIFVTNTCVTLAVITTESFGLGLIVFGPLAMGFLGQRYLQFQHLHTVPKGTRLAKST